MVPRAVAKGDGEGGKSFLFILKLFPNFIFPPFLFLEKSFKNIFPFGEKALLFFLTGKKNPQKKPENFLVFPGGSQSPAIKKSFKAKNGHFNGKTALFGFFLLAGAEKGLFKEDLPPSPPPLAAARGTTG